MKCAHLLKNKAIEKNETPRQSVFLEMEYIRDINPKSGNVN